LAEMSTTRILRAVRAALLATMKRPLGSALFLLGIALLWPWIEPRPGQFEARPRVTSASWWWTPIETNAGNRPPIITLHLRGISVTPGSAGRRLIAVGWEGVYYSNDSGTRWNLRREVRSYLGREKMSAVTFVTPESGWAVGDAVVRKKKTRRYAASFTRRYS